MDLEDVLLAGAALDEGVLAVGAEVRPLARVDHPVVVVRVLAPELELAELALHVLLAVRLDVVLEVDLGLVPAAALVADEGARGVVGVEPQDVRLQGRLLPEPLEAHRALEVLLAGGGGGGDLTAGLGMEIALVRPGRAERAEPLAAERAQDLPLALAVDPPHVDLGGMPRLEHLPAEEALVRPVAGLVPRWVGPEQICTRSFGI